MNATVNVVDVEQFELNGTYMSVFQELKWRLASFARYPRYAVMSAILLAIYGFKYIGGGDSDRVQCEFCSVEKEKWEANENIEHVHHSLSPTCPMANIERIRRSAPNAHQHYGGAVSGTLSPASNTAYAGQRRGRHSEELYSDSSDCRRGASFAGSVGDTSVNVRSHMSASDSQKLLSDCVGAVASDAYSFNPVQNITEENEIDHSNRNLIVDNSSHNKSREERQYIALQNTDIYPSIDPGHQTNSIVTTHDTDPRVCNSSGDHRNHSISNQHSRAERNPNSTADNAGAQTTIRPSSTFPPPKSNTRMTAAPYASSQPSNSAQQNLQMNSPTLREPIRGDQAMCDKRLASFQSCAEFWSPHAEILAKAGFFYDANFQCCRCFYCGFTLRSSHHRNDDPFVLHALSENCCYVCGYFGEEFVAVAQRLSRDRTISFDDIVRQMRSEGLIYRSCSVTEETAISSLIDNGWPENRVFSAVHKLKEKGKAVTAHALLKTLNKEDSIATEAGTVVTDAERLQILSAQNAALRNDMMCKICMDKEKRMIFIPCGHVISCDACAVLFQFCPACSEHITLKTMVTFSRHHSHQEAAP